MLTRFFRKYYWIHFSIHYNRITNENLFLIIENPHIDSALIYRKQSDNTYLTLGKSGDQLPFSTNHLQSEHGFSASF